MKNTIVAATQNEHKIIEMEAITKEFGFTIATMKSLGFEPIDIIEDGVTFEANSYKKAYEIMKYCNMPTIADDSGLVVDCLDGAPGVYSARFAGENATDKDNNLKLISLIKDIPYEKRTAKFISVITVVLTNGESIVAKGEVKGKLILEETGTNGFGYDSLFVPNGYDQTFGQLNSDIKNGISHRSNALIGLREQLKSKRGPFLDDED